MAKSGIQKFSQTTKTPKKRGTTAISPSGNSMPSISKGTPSTVKHFDPFHGNGPRETHSIGGIPKAKEQNHMPAEVQHFSNLPR